MHVYLETLIIYASQGFVFPVAQLQLQQTHESKKQLFRKSIQKRLFTQKICPFELIICEQIAMTLINIGFSFPAIGFELENLEWAKMSHIFTSDT